SVSPRAIGPTLAKNPPQTKREGDGAGRRAFKFRAKNFLASAIAFTRDCRDAFSMSETPGASHRVEEQFSLPRFLFTVAASLAALVALLRLAAPDSVWHAQRSAAPWQFIAVFLAMHLFTCFIEYMFHRYVLHKPVVPFLSQ